MNILIIEDEQPAARLLREKLESLRPDAYVLDVVDSVKGTLNWLYKNERPLDLIFMDIELADGRSFEIFKHASVPAPVIFTTAYDQYAVEAFRVNAIDYILKPVDRDELESALRKWQRQDHRYLDELQNKLDEITASFVPRKKNRCLVKKGGVYEFIHVKDIAMAYSEESVTYLVTYDGRRHMYSLTIEQLLLELGNSEFYQVNRAQLVNVDNILEVHPYLGQRLKLRLRESGKVEEVLVSRQRASSFKAWLDS